MSANTNEITRGGEPCVRDHEVVSHKEWLTAREAFLVKEKELMRQKDLLDAERRKLPWERVEKNYTFIGENGPVTLSELFGGKSQLFIYHFMFAPEWEEGCSGCSFLADHIDSANLHLPAADVAVAVVARAPIDKLLAFKKRMGWKFNFVSSGESDFNYDYAVSFTPEQAKGKVFYNYAWEDGDPEFTDGPGSSAFYKNGAGEIFHTYSTFSRGGEAMIATYNFLDIMPKGRNEEAGIMNWMKKHDQYEAAGAEEACECCSSAVNAGKELAEPRIEDVEEMHLAGFKETFSVAGDPAIVELWMRFGPLVGKVPGQKGGATFAVVSGCAKSFDYMAAVRVETPTGLTADERLTVVTMPARKYAKFRHEGPLPEMKLTCGAIYGVWAPKSGVKLDMEAPMLEYYPPEFCPDKPEGVEIWVPLA
jgi:predicted dithiol-disulfide oxidoreductase (DUF899 family)/predicted transcriptional regulator YdeE